MESPMKKPRSDAQKTRLRLLEAASEIFGNKGFWGATHEDICKKAKANAAAINYHFGNKENLYAEAWKHAFEKSIKKHPPEGKALPDDPADKKIRGRIESFFQRLADPEAYDVDIMLKEIANPTGFLLGVIMEAIEPIDRVFKSVLGEAIGKGATREQIDFCHMSISGLCFGPMLHLRSISKKCEAPKPGFMHLNLEVEELADYTIRFSMAGIRSFKET